MAINLANGAVFFAESFSLYSGKVDFTIQIAIMRIGLSILCIKGSLVDFPNKCVLQSLNIAFIIANNADPDVMQQTTKLPFRKICTSRLTSGKMWQLYFVVVDLLTLKLLIFSLVRAYFGTPRLHQIAPFLSKFSWGSMPPDPPSMSRAVYCYSLPMHLLCNPLFK